MRRTQPTTVGEMIALHHWRDALDRARREDQAFRATPLGAALTRWENALANAWQKDCQETVSDRVLSAAWEREEQARREFLTLLDIAIRKPA